MQKYPGRKVEVLTLLWNCLSRSASCFSLCQPENWHVIIYEGEPEKSPQELYSWGRVLCTTGFPHKGSVLGTHLYQCTRWHCERLCSASVDFFEDSLNMFAHFTMSDLRAHLPTPHWGFSSFWPKMAWPLCPTFPIHLILPDPLFCCCFPGWKKSSKGKVLPMWKRWNKNQQKH